MDNDYFTLKNILAVISAPITFILGMAGWHYKNIYNKVENLDDTTNKLQILVHEHNVHVNHLNESFTRLDNKIELIFKKLNIV